MSKLFVLHLKAQKQKHGSAPCSQASSRHAPLSPRCFCANLKAAWEKCPTAAFQGSAARCATSKPLDLHELSSCWTPLSTFNPKRLAPKKNTAKNNSKRQSPENDTATLLALNSSPELPPSSRGHGFGHALPRIPPVPVAFIWGLIKGRLDNHHKK